MSSAFRRQYPRERVEQRDAALHWRLKLVDQFGEDAWLVPEQAQGAARLRLLFNRAD